MTDTEQPEASNQPTETKKIDILPMGRIARRVLGVLIEKGMCTPEQYPLTLNSLTTGCNQKSARDPVTDYTSDQIEEAVISLQKLGLVNRVQTASGRTDRWRHTLKESWLLEKPERAVLGELLLRGPQTEGDLRSRASRMAEIPTLEDLKTALLGLASKGIVKRLSPAGQARGVVWTHLIAKAEELAEWEKKALSDVPASTSESSDDDSVAHPSVSHRATSSHSSAAANDGLKERVEQLEAEVKSLRDRLEELEQLIK